MNCHVHYDLYSPVFVEFGELGLVLCLLVLFVGPRQRSGGNGWVLFGILAFFHPEVLDSYGA